MISWGKTQGCTVVLECCAGEDNTESKEWLGDPQGL
jgi:hypothetical protein